MPDLPVAILMEPTSAHVDNYLSGLAEARGVGQIAITDPDGTMAARAAKRVPASRMTVFRDYRELLAKVKPGLALVTYPADLAPPVVAAALDANCHVVVEKPGCVRVSDFVRLVQTADSKHRHLQLALANRALPLVLRARTLVDQGVIGRPYAAHLHLVADQSRLKRPGYPQTWFSRKSRTLGGFLAWLGLHYIDLLYYMTNDHARQVTAMIQNANRLPIEVEDSVGVALNTHKGVLATVHGGYYVSKGYQSGLHLWGSEGWLRLDINNGPQRLLEWCNYPGGGKVESATSEAADAYKAFLQMEVTAILENRPALISPAESLHIVQTLDAAYRAAAQGKTQQI